jgi:UPF0271 protein
MICPEKYEMELEDRMKRIYVLDSGAFMSYAACVYANNFCVTTYHIVEELRSMEASVALDIFLKHGLDIVEPSREKIKEIKEVARKNNENVSDADISIVALAKDFKDKGKNVVVVSDDYAVQNLCKILGIDYEGIEKEGIKEMFKWIKKCSVCGRRVDGAICEHCGSNEFKFVPQRE